MLSNFWNYWEVLYIKVHAGAKIFNPEYLFSGSWKETADNWFVLSENDSFQAYIIKLNKLDYINIEACMQLFSGIGFQTLMPQGIKILTKQLNSDFEQLLKVDFYYGEKLIMRCFQDNIKLIKEDNVLLEDFLWFLNLMVDLGSSKAFYIRENIILYK